jgi:hypothetical protein
MRAQVSSNACTFDARTLGRVGELHAAMLGRARRAIDCWSVAALRCGVVKDVRVMIAKMAWAEAWRWGEHEHVQEARLG